RGCGEILPMHGIAQIVLIQEAIQRVLRAAGGNRRRHQPSTHHDDRSRPPEGQDFLLLVHLHHPSALAWSICRCAASGVQSGTPCSNRMTVNGSARSAHPSFLQGCTPLSAPGMTTVIGKPSSSSRFGSAVALPRTAYQDSFRSWPPDVRKS